MKKNRLIRFPGLLKRFRKNLMFIKCCIVFIFVFSLNLSAHVFSQSKLVTLDLKEVSVEKFVDAVKQQTGMKMMYNSGVVSVQVKDKELSEVLDMVLKKVNLEYELYNDIILIRAKGEVPAGPKVLKGVVKDKSGAVLPGVTVVIKGTTLGVSTDIDGKYSITIPEDGKETVLMFTFVGMKPQEVRYAGQETLNVILTEEVAEMEEVVVNGYFTRKKESFTGVSKTFSGDELKTISTGNILNTLSVLDPSFTKVVNNEMGSDPNTIPDFEIRGSSSLKAEYENNPNMPTFIMDGFEVTAQKVFDLDPNRVRYITILKDAAATAIYGSRAANGVVVIETVLPKAGKLQLSYNGSANFEIADLSDYNLMNAEEKLEYEVRSGLYEKSSKPGWTDDKLDAYNRILKLVKEGNDVDWLSIPVRELGVGHKHTVMAEGGNESFRYAFDLFYSNKVGVMKGSKRDNYGGGIRLQYNLKNLKFSNYASFDHLKSVNSPYGSFSSYLYYNPYYNPYDENGNVKKVLYSYEYYDRGITSKTMYNELYNAVLPSKNQQTSNNFLNNFSIEYDIIQGLKLKANLSLSVDNGKTDVYKSYENTEFLDKEKKGSYAQSTSNDFSYDINVILSYFKSLKKHFINLGFVYNLQEKQYDNTSIYVVGFPNANMDHVSIGSGYQEGAKPGGSFDVTRLVGFVGNLGYTYDNRFLLDASVRSDGSSIYGSNNRWGTFWSVGVGYNIHNEKFMKNWGVINLLKIRGSIGTTGGQNFSPYQAMAMYSYNDSRINTISYSGYLGAIMKAFGNKNLKWQKVEKQNVGLDFEIFHSRLTGSFNVYRDLSKDVLIDVSIAPSLGFSSYKENLGEVKNSGVEVNLKGTVISNPEKRIRWDLFVNAVYNKNELLKMNDALLAYNDVQDKNTMESGNRKPIIRYQEGLSINTIWANESLGIDPNTGSEIFLNLDNEKVTAWSVKNYKPLGCTDPKVRGNFGTVLYYKNFSLNAYFAYSWGGQIYNQTLVDKVENVDPEKNADRRVLYQRWQEPGDVAYFKAIDDKTRTMPTSRFIEDNNYLTLSSLNISYEFGADVLRKLSIDRLKFSLIGNELFRSSTVKMERGLTYPFARTFTFAMQVSF